MKKYFFLAGLHRSGNTVLSSILNQNPEIYSSALTPVCEFIWQCHVTNITSQSALMNTDSNRATNVISNILDNYYYDVNKPIIIDREKNWATPANIDILKTYIDKNPKIIFTTRPIVEILASFIAIDKENIISRMILLGWQFDEKVPMNDAICDFLMHEDGELRRTMLAIESIRNPDSTDNIHVVKYDDLINSPQKTMDDIYKFLEIPSFVHDFENIEKIEKYDYQNAGFPKDLHEVRKILKRSDVVVEDYLSKESIEKYSGFKYF